MHFKAALAGAAPEASSTQIQEGKLALRKRALCPGGGGYAPTQAGVMVMALRAGSAQLGALLVGFEFCILGASRSTNAFLQCG